MLVDINNGKLAIGKSVTANNEVIDIIGNIKASGNLIITDITANDANFAKSRCVCGLTSLTLYEAPGILTAWTNFSLVFRVDFQAKDQSEIQILSGVYSTLTVWWWQVELLSDEIDMQSGGKIMSDAARDVLVLL